MSDETGWADDIWTRLRAAVHAEVERSAVARRVLPLRSTMSEATTASSGAWQIESREVCVGQGETVPIVEISLEFRLTGEQVRAESREGAAESAARMLASLLAFAEDLIVFRSASGEPRGQNLMLPKALKGWELPALPGETKRREDLSVQPIQAGGGHGRPQYGLNTVQKVEEAAAWLFEQGFVGPFALILRPEEFVDLKTRYVDGDLRVVPREILPPEVIQIESSRALEPKTGLVLALGGHPIELITPPEAYSIECLHVDPEGFFKFRLRHRFALRIKNDNSIVKLEFKLPGSGSVTASGQQGSSPSGGGQTAAD